MSYRLRTLGGVSLSSETGVLDGSVTQRRRLALLSLVAAAGDRGVTRDRLIGMLWPDSDSAKARQVLTQWLHLIRRDLGDHDLFLGTVSLRLNFEHMSCDVTELWSALERDDVERAAALYAGPFLDGFYLNGAPEFERWVEEERARIAIRMRGAYETLLGRASAAGETGAAISWAKCVAALDPLDSRAALALMRVLADAGDRAGAIRHARVHAALVRDQLDADVDPAIAAFADELRAMPAPAVAPRPTTSAPPAETSEDVEAPAPATDRMASRTTIAAGDSVPASWLRDGLPARRVTQVLAATGVVAVLIVVGAALSSRHPAAPLRSRVIVTPFENATGDTSLNVLGLMAADWIIRGVGETGLEIAGDAPTSRGNPLAAGPRRFPRAEAGTLISGRYYLRGDSLAFQARIIDLRDDRVMGVVGPVVATRHHELDALESLRQRVMGSVAELVDERYSALASQIAVPPSYEAFRELTYGDAAANRRRHREAAEHYRRAAQLDTTWLFPVVQLARSHGNMEDCPPVDSLGRSLAPKRDRLTRYEALQLDRELQTCAGDLLGAYRSARALHDLVPTSEATTMYLARNASALNRSREVVQLLLPDGEASRPPTRLNALAHLTMALHALGEYRRELEIARFARERYPDLFEPALYEVRALAALGDVKGVQRVVTSALMMGSGAATAIGEGVIPTAVAMAAGHELRAHGHEAEGREITRGLADWLERHPPPEGNPRAERDYLLVLVGADLDVERWSDAQRAIERLARNCGDCLGVIAARGELAAHRRDVAEAHRIAGILARARYPYMRGQNTHARAQIAAILGERELAVSLLHDAFAEGLRFDMYGPYRLRSFNHALPEFASLRGYPPFEELLRPKE